MRKLLTILLFLISFSAYATTPHYAILIDAGSNGSRLHLFQYDDAKPLPVISDIFSANISPGLSSYADSPTHAAPALKKLFDDAAEKLKSLNVPQKEVTVDILATAGMRLLPEAKQQAIYQNIQNYLNANYQFNIHHVETISGKMEGVYGWLDVNYLANRFDGAQDVTYGILDMGGASSEIAFSTKDTTKTADEINLVINNKPYTIFSKSYFKAGLDQMRNDMNNSHDAGTCYPKDYDLPGNDKGRFNFDTCSSIYTALIKNKNFFNVKEIPAFNNELIAYSGIYYTFNFLKVDEAPTQKNVREKIDTVCNKTWSELKKDPQYANVPDKYLSAYCANGVYNSLTLFTFLNVDDTKLHVQSKVNQKNIDWTLGALLYSLLS